MRGTKVLCSVRSEILTAISRFITTKEINKVISGFSVSLNWNYTNSNSYAHPIVQILLKRIAMCSEADDMPSLDLYRMWFPERIHDMEPAHYILNNSWCKPRDMVRLISTAQNSLHNNDSKFSQAVFNSIAKDYSEGSLQEIKEELRALYTSEEIDIIISCFTGYKTSFSINELKERIQLYFSDTILDHKFMHVLNDLYRLGFLGNFLPSSKSYHWQHKGDSTLIISGEWNLFVHYALHGALSLGSRNDYGQIKSREIRNSTKVKATITEVVRFIAFASFTLNGNTYTGSIHSSEFRKLGYAYIDWLPSIVQTGEEFEVILGEYDNEHSCWRLKLV